MLILVFSFSFYSFKKKEDAFCKEYPFLLERNLKEFLKNYDNLYKYVQQNSKESLSKDSLVLYYTNVRYSFKKTEMVLEYFAPGTSAMINAALIPDVDEYDPNQFTNEPEGLQLIEELIYNFEKGNTKLNLEQELKRTRGTILRAKQIAGTIEPLKFQIFEAAKQQIIRIWTVNLTGMDATYSKNSVMESAYTLESIDEVLKLLVKNSDNKKVKKEASRYLKLSKEAKNYFYTNTSFDSFDRLYFVRNYANKLYSILSNIEIEYNTDIAFLPTVISANAENIFDKRNWNGYYFSSSKQDNTNPSMVNLGEMLFFDPILSGNNKRACASCHRPEYGFAEPIAKSILFEQEGELNRNAPSLLNTVFQKAYFLDARTTYLEDQVVEVNQNKNEMHGNFDQLVHKLNGSEEYKRLFKNSFAGTEDTTIKKHGIIKAIAAYERSLVSMNSKFDKFMRNEKVELSKSEVNGFNLFMGKAQCGTCHFAPFFNGTVPPNFDETELEIIGTPETDKNNKLDEDKGRYNVAKMEIHQYAFKTPTVRNIMYTAPYMHNGVYKKLEDVLDFYNNGGGIGHGYDVPNQTLPSDSLKLTKSEMNDIISFMNILSDTVGLTKKPSRLPELKVAGQLIIRKVGGEY